MPKLYIVATPIGNLKDITLRAIEVLRDVDIILAEDTRQTRKLLSHLGLRKQLIPFHKFSPKGTEEKAVRLLKEGKDLALVTDAGTPGISDPGYWLNKNAVEAGIEIIPIPGPSSISAMVSVSDIDLTKFIFLGFPPIKKGRKTFFERISRSSEPVILFESPHRILKTLEELHEYVGDKYVNIGRELTKIHEEVFRGSLSVATEHFTGEKERGEFIIVIE
jgi:16S rRNA (cytidine1402-2'-O)-methyltransferase